MRRQTALRVLNPVLLLLVLYQGVTGFLRFRMYDHFKAAHPVAGGALLVLAVVHLVLNWPWVRSQYLSRKKAPKRPA